MHHNLLFLKLLKQSRKKQQISQWKHGYFEYIIKNHKKNFTGKDGKNIFTSKPVNWSKNSQLYPHHV